MKGRGGKVKEAQTWEEGVQVGGGGGNTGSA